MTYFKIELNKTINGTVHVEVPGCICGVREGV